ncbi:DUF1287 domain-containing protein [Campylobacter curvus]|uniref:DUF1287 domain-containing protein n=1 Tax=Campylobacter curvus TaxID=200 RepID=UPI0014707737|nr:DUF1287 domain-containing protein [Campylobacter curvus]
MKIFKILMLFATALFAFSPQKLVTDAKSQIGVTIYYDPSYSSLAYPMGDVEISKGVCSDVLVRALRLQNIDLQKLIHDDMAKNFSSYPKKWGLKGTDKNIDHRRVLNIATYLKRRGLEVNGATFMPGDILTWQLPGNLPHIGIVSDKFNGSTPLIIHNIGSGTQEEDILDRFKLTGHFRIK